MYRSFKDLEVWKRGCKLAVDVYPALKDSKEFIHFQHIAKGSAAELRTQLYIAEKIGILTSTISRPLIAETKEISSMLQGLIKSKKPKT